MRKTIDVSIPHQLTRDEARERLRSGAARLQSQFGGGGGEGAPMAQVSQTWRDYHNDFCFTAMGQSITGRMDVEADAIKLSVDVPWMLAMLGDTLRARIEQEGRKLLEKK